MESQHQKYVPGVTLLGIARLDQDHLVLARIMDQLEAVLGSYAPRERAIPLLRELSLHAHQHFAREERWMREDGYPRLALHQDEHRSLLVVIASIGREFEAGTIELNERLLSDLWQWVNHHIANADAEYAAYIKGDRLPQATTRF